jgi:hypothetical protein
VAKLGDLLKSDIAKGIAIGVGIGAVALVVFPALRPAAKAAIRSGILAAEKGRVLVVEAMESLEDLAAEVRAEMAEADFGEEAHDARETATADSEA